MPLWWVSICTSVGRVLLLIASMVRFVRHICSFICRNALIDHVPLPAGATIAGNDLSLFYGNESDLTTITDRQRFLPAELYKQLVQDTVICCVDILLVRFNPTTRRKEALLVERGSEPAKGYWWLPGGRLLKGETFFAAAQRKAEQETGLTAVQPIQVLGVWNTFFPSSSWDTPESKGTQTVNPIVLVEVQQDSNMIQLDAQSENYRWIGLDPAAAEAAGEDRYVLEALHRLEAWDSSYSRSSEEDAMDFDDI